MGLRPITTLVGLTAFIFVASAQDPANLHPCGQECFNSVIASGLGCDSGDNQCLCANQNFGWGLQDCAQEACDAEVGRELLAYLESLCTESASETGAEGTAVPNGSVSSPVATPSAPGAETSGQMGESPSSSPASPATGEDTFSQASATLNAPVSTPSTAAPTVTPADAASPSSPGSSAVDDSPSDEPGEADGAPAPAASLSTPAKIGIGVGAGVAALGVGLAIFLLLRRRRPGKANRDLQISDPMPGAGREYSGGIASLPAKNMSELEIKSQRYEHMVPRQTPRHLI